MAKLTLHSAPAWMRETFTPYKNRYVLDKDMILNLLPKNIVDAIGGAAAVQLHVAMMNQDSNPANNAELESFITELSFHAPVLARTLLKVADKLSFKDNVWTDLKQPIEGITNVLMGVGSAVLSLLLIIKNIITLPIEFFDKGFTAGIANLFLSLDSLWNDFKTLLNGLLQIIATPLLLVRIPARLLTKPDSALLTKPDSADCYPGRRAGGIPPELGALFASAMSGMGQSTAGADFTTSMSEGVPPHLREPFTGTGSHFGRVG